MSIGLLTNLAAVHPVIRALLLVLFVVLVLAVLVGGRRRPWPAAWRGSAPATRRRVRRRTRRRVRRRRFF
jgi:hypothetical protein